MSTALIELHYLPCIQYLSKLLKYEKVIIEQQENYQKGSYRNRCHLAASNGLLRLSIPLVKGKNQQQNIREVRLDQSQPWQRLHWRAIQSAYGKTPFFEHYQDELFPFYQKNYIFLFDWNKDLLEKLIDLLNLSVQLEWSKEYLPQAPSHIVDLRGSIRAKGEATIADPHFSPPTYPQAFVEKTGFLPNLSILDLLFCTGPEALSYLEASIL